MVMLTRLSLHAPGFVLAVLLSAASPAQLPSVPLAGGVSVHVVREGDTLVLLAARFGVSASLLAADNSLSSNAVLRPGQTLIIDNRHLVPEAPDGEEIIVNIPQRMLFRYDAGRIAAAYPVAVGSAGWQTFTGPFEVTTLEIDPTWDVPISIQDELRRAGKPVLTRVPPGPDNPLGRFWIELSRPGFGIHGTNAPTSIYGFRTHGCIRLHPDDIAALFAHTCVGAKGRSVYQPVLLGVDRDGAVLLEANPDPYRAASPDPLAAIGQWLAARGISAGDIDWARVRAALRTRQGRPVPISARAPSRISAS